MQVCPPTIHSQSDTSGVNGGDRSKEPRPQQTAGSWTRFLIRLRLMNMCVPAHMGRVYDVPGFRATDWKVAAVRHRSVFQSLGNGSRTCPNGPSSAGGGEPGEKGFLMESITCAFR